jgi:glycosyltransferase involved in cell wall biosynthesis
MRPLNILDLRDTDEVGGPGKTILETGRAIDPQSFRVHVGVFQTRREGAETPFTAAARAYDLPVHAVQGHNQYDPRLISRTAALVRHLGIDIVHAHEVKSDVIAGLAALLYRVPLVTTLHGWIGNSRKQRAFIALDRRVVRRFDLVIAVSRPILQQGLDAGVPESRIRLLHNAIVLSRYRREPGGGDLSHILGRAPRAPVLCTIGRLSAEKGHADLLVALAQLAASGHRMEAVLVGDGPERPRLVERVRALGLEGWVHFPGYLEQPQRVLNDADLMVLPSHTEGLPNAALEALAMDVPVLATRVGGTPEVIVDGTTGRLVPPRDPAAMANALEEFLTCRGSWKDMALRGKRHVEQHFDFGARTRQLELMYLELAREARR